MKKIAILASANMMPSALTQRDDSHERDEQMKKLLPAFLSQNMHLDIISWKLAANQAKHYDAMLPLFVWDYFEGNDIKFIKEMERVDKITNLYNSIDVIKWNSKKSYLQELEKKGAPVIETIYVDFVSQTNITKAFDLDHYLISNPKNLDNILKKIIKIKKPLFVEVITDNKQIIYDAYKDY